VPVDAIVAQTVFSQLLNPSAFDMQAGEDALTDLVESLIKALSCG
jgi:hypothetical protein